MLLLLYNITRAFTVSVTHDEALTYQMYVSGSYTEILDHPALTINNHFLNSLFAKLCIDIFGDHLFVLRLPNIIAQIVYLSFSLHLSRRLFRRPFMMVACFLLLQFNPFLFDFWGLSRGYGLAVASVTGSAYFLLKYAEDNKAAAIIWSVFFLVCGVYSSLSVLNYAMGVYAVMGCLVLTKRNVKTTKTVLITGISSAIVLFLLLYKPISVLMSKNEFIYGGENGFIRDTVGSLITESFYLSENNGMVYGAAILVALTAWFCLLWWIRRFAGQRTLGAGAILSLLLFVPVLSSVVQYFVLDTKFLMDRTALFYFPLYILLLMYTMSKVSGQYQVAIRSLSVGLLILFGVNFVAHASLHSTRTWAYDKNTPWLLKHMIAHKKNAGKIKIYMDWMYTPTFRYYIPRNYPGRFDYIEGQNEVAFGKEEYDFYLVRAWELQKIPDIYIKDTVFNNEQFYLYERKHWDNDK